MLQIYKRCNCLIKIPHEPLVPVFVSPSFGANRFPSGASMVSLNGVLFFLMEINGLSDATKGTHSKCDSSGSRQSESISANKRDGCVKI